MGEVRQHKQKVASELAKQPSDELGGQYSENSRETDEFNRSHVQVDNAMSETSEHPNIVITVTSQNVFSHTDPTTQPGVNNEPLHSNGGLGGLCTHPLQ